ncbi:MAG TPA: hypothetical protein VG964_01080 [Candidatus Saccharimonadales bacterium]|jgi:hypothetical protein|nr:hypothetical protein [Candidatus Saccharimonadales bacterium]
MIPKISLSEGFTEEMIHDYADSAKYSLVRPLGRLIFSARRVKICFVSSRRARQEADIFEREIFSIEGISGGAENTEEFYRQRRETHYQEGIDRLIKRTVEANLGSDSFLAELAPLTDD